MEERRDRLKVFEIDRVHAEFVGDNLRKNLRSGHSLIGHDVVDRMAAIDGFIEKLVSGGFVEKPVPLENVDDLMGIHEWIERG